MSEQDLRDLHALFLRWLEDCHRAARKRNGMAWCEAADIRETWQQARRQA